MHDSILAFLGHDHRHCDDLYTDAEEAVSTKDWDTAKQKTEAFIQAMELHFTLEEDILFPTFEQVTGHTAGPTVVMRIEHQQMRGLFKDMQQALEAQASSDFLGLGETLLMLIQQHNFKEEQILYTMSDRALGDQRQEVVQKMAQLMAEVR